MHVERGAEEGWNGKGEKGQAPGSRFGERGANRVPRAAEVGQKYMVLRHSQVPDPPPLVLCHHWSSRVSCASRLETSFSSPSVEKRGQIGWQVAKRSTIIAFVYTKRRMKRCQTLQHPCSRPPFPGHWPSKTHSCILTAHASMGNSCRKKVEKGKKKYKKKDTPGESRKWK